VQSFAEINLRWDVKSMTASASSPGSFLWRSDPLMADIGLAVARLGLGITMAAHGTQKLFGWFGGAGPEGTGAFMSSLGYPAGKAMAIIAGLTETLGGLGIALGFVTAIAGSAVLGTMVNAAWIGIPSGFMSGPAGVGYDLALILATGAAALTLTGPGRFSVDQVIGNRNRGIMSGLIWVIVGLGMAVLALLCRN
jgi:putative oxidoreductase